MKQMTICSTVLCAMAISSAGGKILESAIVVYPDMASYQPVINGVAGNLVGLEHLAM